MRGAGRWRARRRCPRLPSAGTGAPPPPPTPGRTLPEIGTLAVAATNGAVDTVVRSLALELAPIRVNAASPGVVDTGARDGLGEQAKSQYFKDTAAKNPARRIGTA